MKKNVILFGKGNLTDILFYYFKKFNLAEVVAFTVDKNYITGNDHHNLPLISFEELEQHFSPAQHELLIPLSPNKMNKLREIKFNEAKQKGYTLSNFVHPSVSYDCSEIGTNNIIFENVILQPYSRIGNNNVIWSGCYIGHHVVIGNHNWISAGAMIGGESKINNNCFVGINSLLKNNLLIESETFIGMGLTINRSTKTKEVFTGENAAAHKITSDKLGKII